MLLYFVIVHAEKQLSVGSWFHEIAEGRHHTSNHEAESLLPSVSSQALLCCLNPSASHFRGFLQSLEHGCLTCCCRRANTTKPGKSGCSSVLRNLQQSAEEQEETQQSTDWTAAAQLYPNLEEVPRFVAHAPPKKENTQLATSGHILC